jgi:1-acyl-sn-glycerol-3-phosphate acyltransferase
MFSRDPQQSVFPFAEDTLSYLWYETFFWVSGPAMTLAFSLRTEGMRNVPRNGPALLIANHQSYFDPDLVGLAARRHLCYLARKTLFRHRVFRWLIRSLRAIPIDQEGIGIEGIRDILEQLQRGRAVLIFPEGERTHDGLIHPLRPGIALLIKKAKAPVVPVGIAGAYEAWSRHRSFPIPAPLFLPAQKGTIAVSVGQPLDGRQLAELPRERILDQLFQELQKVHHKANRLRKTEDP